MMPASLKFGALTTALLLLLVFVPTSAQWRGNSCSVDSLNIVLLSRDAKTGEYALVKRLESNNIPKNKLNEGTFRQRRRLLGFEDLKRGANAAEGYHGGVRGGIVGSLPGIHASSARMLLQDVDTNISNGTQANFVIDEQQEQLYYARECDCHYPRYKVVYCPFVAEMCRAPALRDVVEQPGCLTYPRDQESSYTLFMVAFLWFIMLFTVLLCTSFGRNFGGCLISTFMITVFRTNCWNRLTAKRLMERRPERARMMIMTNIIRRRQILERRLAAEGVEHPAAQASATQQAAPTTEPATSVPVSFRLKTRIYRSPRALEMEAATAADATSIGGGGGKGNIMRKHSARSIASSDGGSAHDGNAPSAPSHGTHQQQGHGPTHQRRHSRGSNADVSGTFDVADVDLELVRNGGYDAMDNMDELDNDCTICFAPIMDGDRVGALECDHLFHVDCLKTWVVRRNVCPLCQSFHLATPQFKTDDEMGNDSTGSPATLSSSNDTLLASPTRENGAPQSG